MYTKGEVVWAKIKGFPWWPGVVAKVIEQKDNPDNLQEILVNFIGENSHARLPLDKVAKFNQNFSEFSKMKKKKLLESIEVAKKIISGETSYEAESQKLDSKTKNKTILTTKRKRDEISFENSDDESVDTILESPIPNKKDKGRKPDKPAKLTKERKLSSISTMSNNNNNNSTTQISKSPVIHSSNPKSSLQRKNSNPLQNVSNTKLNASNNGNGSVIIPAAQKKISEYKPGPRKMLKLDDSDDEKKTTESGVLISQSSSITSHNNIHNAITTIATEKELERKVSDVSIIPNNAQLTLFNKLPQRTQTQLPNTTKIISEFKSVIDQIIETIVNLEASALGYNSLEKTLKTMLNPLNYENVPAPEIVEKDIGKYLYTIVSLIEVLENTYESANIKLALLNMKEYKGQLHSILNEMKTSLISHYIEDKNYVNTYMLQLSEKREERERERNRLKELQKIELQKRLQERLQEEAEKLVVKLEEEFIEIEEIDSTKGSKDSKEKDPDSNNFRDFKKMTQNMKEINKNKSSSSADQKKKKEGMLIEEEKSKASSLKPNGVMSSMGGNATTTATTPTNTLSSTTNTKNISTKSTILPIAPVLLPKISDIDNKSQKSDDPRDEGGINNPQLRKKICLKMSKILGDKYNLELKTARDLTIKIENKIRSLNPDMKQEYRDKILIILRCLKFAIINPDEFVKEPNTDFNQLKEKLEEFAKSKEQSGDRDNIFGNGLQDSPIGGINEASVKISDQNQTTADDMIKSNANTLTDDI